jgi:hypothetical protein
MSRNLFKEIITGLKGSWPGNIDSYDIKRDFSSALPTYFDLPHIWGPPFLFPF